MFNLWYYLFWLVRSPILGWRMVTITFHQLTAQHQIRAYLRAYMRSYEDFLGQLQQVEEALAESFDVLHTPMSRALAVEQAERQMDEMARGWLLRWREHSSDVARVA